MRCLVTGAYGFIGSEVTRALEREGWTVVVGCSRDLAEGSRLLPGSGSAGRRSFLCSRSSG